MIYMPRAMEDSRVAAINRGQKGVVFLPSRVKCFEGQRDSVSIVLLQSVFLCATVQLFLLQQLLHVATVAPCCNCYYFSIASRPFE